MCLWRPAFSDPTTSCIELEEKISYLEDISKLEESVLEIRRFEKNYFLYGDQQSLNTALYHLSRVRKLLDKNAAKIQASPPRNRRTVSRGTFKNMNS